MILLLSLLACSTPDSADSASPNAEACTPSAQLSKVRQDYGDVRVGQLARAEVEVENPGTCSLTVTGAAIEDPTLADGFAVSFKGPITVAGGDSTTIKVDFKPTAEGTAENGLVIESDTPDAELRMALVGNGIPAPDLTITPEPIDLPEVHVGCSVAAPVALTNSSSVPVDVTDLSLTAGSPTLTLDLDTSTNGPLPWTIPAGGERIASVTFTPVDDAPVSGSFSVTSTDFNTPAVVLDVNAAGTWPEPRVQTWTADPRVDVVFVVDTSSSMRDGDLDALDAAWPAFVEAAVATGADYQIAVVTETDGCVVSSGSAFVTPTESTADQVGALESMVSLASSGGEEGFAILANATDPAAVGAGGCNDGLLRSGAPLAVVGYTDSPELSGRDWATYLTVFQGLVAAADDFTAHAIAGDLPSGCGSAEAGTGWYEITAATGGDFFSICADVASSLTTLAASVFPAAPSRYELEAFPLDGSIVVTVDGVVTSAWTYASTDNAVQLDLPPGNSSTVTITYYPDECG